MNVRANITAIFIVICVAAESLALVSPSCENPKDWDTMQATHDQAASIKFDLEAKTITLGQPFSFNVAMCEDDQKKPDRVTANAMMPKHQHGMNYTPTVTFNEHSNYVKVSGFVFHMPGQWEITITSYRDDKVTHYTKTITINQ